MTVHTARLNSQNVVHRKYAVRQTRNAADMVVVNLVITAAVISHSAASKGIYVAMAADAVKKGLYAAARNAVGQECNALAVNVFLINLQQGNNITYGLFLFITGCYESFA